MQYLLSEDEYNALKQKQQLEFKLKEDDLQALCTKIANEMPVTVSWYYKGEPTPWRCILNKTDPQLHCDKCPVLEICPNKHKDFSQ